MKTIILTEEEFDAIENFIITDAEDMRDMSRAIETEDGTDLQDQAEIANKTKRELIKRFKGS